MKRWATGNRRYWAMHGEQTMGVAPRRIAETAACKKHKHSRARLQSRCLSIEMRHIPGPLARWEKCDNYLARFAAFAPQFMANLPEREIVAELRTKFHERESCSVLTLAAIGAIEIRVVDVSECRGFELGIFHAATLARIACG
jgi:hypothetical protein